ncbi:MAG: hypothetical protein U5R49_26615 [Deltaproteobacteria bacterium]|nr:hypothetical protein [Deltaproteobacteria bacterium]
MWLKWLPWKYVIRRLARSHGFLDPISLMTRLRGFAKPSEVAEPMELVRAGLLLHARGLVNTKVIQNNLDWIWPFWVEKQFDPTSESFLPRAFSITHVNLTHRNWTAVGLPGCSAFPIVDPRGLVTPQWDGWSLDGWIVTEDGESLCPSKAPESAQTLLYGNDSLVVQTITNRNDLKIDARTYLTRRNHGATCHVDYYVQADQPAWFILALRPYNPEGISSVNTIQLHRDRCGWHVDEKDEVRFDESADRHTVSTYADGDLFNKLLTGSEIVSTSCDVGLATAAALFKLEADREKTVRVTVDAGTKDTDDEDPQLNLSWENALRPAARLDVPDARFVDLYTQAIHTLVLLSPGSIYPGPYTYKPILVSGRGIHGPCAPLQRL